MKTAVGFPPHFFKRKKKCTVELIVHLLRVKLFINLVMFLYNLFYLCETEWPLSSDGESVCKKQKCGSSNASWNYAPAHKQTQIHLHQQASWGHGCLCALLVPVTPKKNERHSVEAALRLLHPADSVLSPGLPARFLWTLWRYGVSGWRAGGLICMHM